MKIGRAEQLLGVCGGELADCVLAWTLALNTGQAAGRTSAVRICSYSVTNRVTIRLDWEHSSELEICIDVYAWVSV
jgi:hypothetical protein